MEMPFKSKLIIITALIALLGWACSCDESWIVPLGSDVYENTEELFINEWQIPPLFESPMISDDLKAQISKMMDKSTLPETIEKGRALIADLKLPFENVSPILETSFFAAFNSETGRRHAIDTNDATQPVEILDFTYLYDAEKVHPLLLAGFTLQAAGFSLCFAPFFTGSHTYLLDYPSMFNAPFDISRIDTSFPHRGIGSYYNAPFEFRFGRDKLSIGPSHWGSLTLNQHVPYYDYLKARFAIDWVNISFYLIQLNPTISSGESDYLLGILKNNPEVNASANGDSYIERSKYYALAFIGLKPVDWLLITIMQTNLIGGRFPWFSDINPLALYHNNFAEGVYSVPLDVSIVALPYKGIKLFFDIYLYDLSVGDETNPDINPGAFAYQAGFTMLSNPFFELGPGRFRLDGELTLVDPWTYGKYYDLRKFTSRIIYVESFVGRFWIDYPLGFYLGPDVIDFHLSLKYGIPSRWEAELLWQLTGKGQIDLYGFGPDSDYSDIAGYGQISAPSGIVEWKNDLELSGYYVPVNGLKISLWYRFRTVFNQYNVLDKSGFYHFLGLEADWKIY
jgi:hypothetical protein